MITEKRKANALLKKISDRMPKEFPVKKGKKLGWKEKPCIIGPKLLDEGGIGVVITGTRSDGIDFYVKQVVKKSKHIPLEELEHEAEALIVSAATRLATHLDKRCTCRIPPSIQSCPVSHYPNYVKTKPKP